MNPHEMNEISDEKMLDVLKELQAMCYDYPRADYFSALDKAIRLLEDAHQPATIDSATLRCGPHPCKRFDDC